MAKPSLKSLYRINKNLLQNEGIGGDSQPVYLRDAPAAVIITSGPKSTQLHNDFYKGDASIAATYGSIMAIRIGIVDMLAGTTQREVNHDP